MTEYRRKDLPHHGWVLLLFLIVTGVLSLYIAWGNIMNLSKDIKVLVEYPVEVQFLAHASTVIWFGRVVGAVAAVFWKKWGIYLLIGLFFPNIVSGIFFYPSNTEVIIGLLPLILLVVLVRPKWGWFN